MLLIPAIDLKDGHCVRLKQGAMEDATVFSEDPAAMARHWIDKGARRLHLVDLNGAFAGKPKNEAAIKAILGGRRRDSGATRRRHPRPGHHRALPR
jgi:phosphoribosylformimino-5-aminoimidazole carboxamide ribotide isomerase